MKVLLAFVLIAYPVFAVASSSGELAALTAQLQKAPSDEALREKIIKLAVGLKPAPAITKEARRRMVRGGAAIKGATSPADYRAAAAEFEKAALEAPWWGDAYYNLAVARDKAEDFAGALAALKLARLASPGNQDAEDLASAVEFRMEKASSPEGRARKDAEWLKKLDGAEFLEPGASWRFIRVDGDTLAFRFRREESGTCLCDDTTRCRGPVGEVVTCRSIALVGRRASKPCATVANCKIDYEIAADGESLVESTEYKQPAGEPPFGPNTFKRKH